MKRFVSFIGRVILYPVATVTSAATTGEIYEAYIKDFPEVSSGLKCPRNPGTSASLSLRSLL
jgi:hypothetical protein